MTSVITDLSDLKIFLCVIILFKEKTVVNSDEGEQNWETSASSEADCFSKLQPNSVIHLLSRGTRR